MLRELFLIMIVIPSMSFAQSKKFSSFELLYDIPQQIPESHTWPKYGLEGMQLYNDTIYTMLVKENYISSIPLLHKKDDRIENKKINLPAECSPLTIIRIKGLWFFVTQSNGVLSLDKNNNFKNFIVKPLNSVFYNCMIIDNRIIVYAESRDGNHFNLYDLKGELLNTSMKGEFVFVNPVEHNDTIRDGFNDFTVKDNKIYISKRYDWKKYGNYSFVGGYQDMGYFVERDERNQFMIRNFKDLSVKERFYIPVKFRNTDLGIPEEDSFNLRVFSQDNKTFYFVTIKHKHLLIYKAVR